MKSDVMPSIVQMDAEELRQLVTEVKETVATFNPGESTVKTPFAAVDLWNIQRKIKSATGASRRVK